VEATGQHMHCFLVPITSVGRQALALESFPHPVVNISLPVILSLTYWSELLGPFFLAIWASQEV
jgi:hypothetical protein